MRKILLAILITTILLSSVNVYSALKKTEENGDKFLSIGKSLNEYFYNFLGRDFFLQQTLDFNMKYSRLNELLKTIEFIISSRNFTVKGGIDRDWINYLVNSNLVSGVLIKKQNKSFITGNIDREIEFIGEGFHIINNSVYYYVENKNTGTSGKFLISSQYISNYLFKDARNSVEKNDFILGSIILEVPKKVNMDRELNTMMLYRNPELEESTLPSFNLFEKLTSGNISSIKLSSWFFKNSANYLQSSFLPLISRKILLSIRGVTYIKRLYSGIDADLVFLTYYKNRITSGYIYSIELLIAFLGAIFLFVMLFMNIPNIPDIPIEGRGGSKFMENNKEERGALDISREEKIEATAASSENLIEEIDNEVSKIEMEENLKERESGKKEEALQKDIKEEEIKVKSEGKENIKIEELKKDGIIIK